MGARLAVIFERALLPPNYVRTRDARSRDSDLFLNAILVSSKIDHERNRGLIKKLFREPPNRVSVSVSVGWKGRRLVWFWETALILISRVVS